MQKQRLQHFQYQQQLESNIIGSTILFDFFFIIGQKFPISSNVYAVWYVSTLLLVMCWKTYEDHHQNIQLLHN